MKAVTVVPGQPGSASLSEVPRPSVSDVPDGRGVLVRVLRVGLDGTDSEIVAGEYGEPPAGSDVLVLGHESFGVVEQVGPAVHELAPGDHVVARVRRAEGSSLYDAVDRPDLTTDTDYYEHGISRVHGFLTEYYVEQPHRLITVPPALRDVGVLLEPTSVVEKAVAVAYEVQQRLPVWRPQRAAVLGAGTVGLLATMLLRNRGLEVAVFGLQEAPYLNSDLVTALGATYVSTADTTLTEAAGGQEFDYVLEATGFSPLVFEAMNVLVARNGVLVLASVTGGNRSTEIPSDAINLGFVLGNKAMVGSVNAAREHFEAGVRDLAVASVNYPGWAAKLLTHPVQDLERYADALALLGTPGAIKVYVEVAAEQAP